MPPSSATVIKKASVRGWVVAFILGFELESSLIKKEIVIPLIPLSDLVEEGQDSKTRVETEPRIHRTKETKISRHLDTFSFSKDAELLCSRKKLHNFHVTISQCVFATRPDPTLVPCLSLSHISFEELAGVVGPEDIVSQLIKTRTINSRTWLIITSPIYNGNGTSCRPIWATFKVRFG